MIPENPIQRASELHSVPLDLLNRCLLRELLAHLKQGVAFVDPQGTVLVWNQYAEIITGIGAVQMMGNKWSPNQVPFFCDSDNDLENHCPVTECLQTGRHIEKRITFARDDEELVTAEIQIISMSAENDQPLGALLIINDRSSEKKLRNELFHLNRQVTLDPLTQVPNRVEFDRTLIDCIEVFDESQVISSLIICDIDFFKRINDDYGHEKGDQALISFAQHLQSFVRDDDLVARYGGEEFVIICRDCDLASAEERAEMIRASLEATAQQELDGKCLTASFGVAQLEVSDTAKSLFVRADHALLNAKESGRNLVLSASKSDYQVPEASVKSHSKAHRWKKTRGEPLIQEQHVTPTPPDVLLTKIRGFIEEQSATVSKIDQDFISLSFGGNQSLFRRGADQSLGLIFEIEMRQESESEGRRGEQTILRCTVRPRRSRDRRREDLVEAASHLVKTLRSYLMISPNANPRPERAATRPGSGRE